MILADFIDANRKIFRVAWKIISLVCKNAIRLNSLVNWFWWIMTDEWLFSDAVQWTFIKNMTKNEMRTKMRGCINQNDNTSDKSQHIQMPIHFAHNQWVPVASRFFCIFTSQCKWNQNELEDSAKKRSIEIIYEQYKFANDEANKKCAALGVKRPKQNISTRK